ncbi:hypothetical protein ETAA8_27990 [Anatilimnocola aggregata]|uniref:Uncharacterized protein n=1 Tax=Anatilimnocola aggregata TaxID=2528021 RepID=A0A517YBU4_9BACT|nr:hypothetical protein [Anatilimnocola aggregata]QDU27710.1 hypothetical protein ETAA8_27990 [Anatilimnocola aggregata]
MARKVINRRELREQSDAAEARGAGADDAEVEAVEGEEEGGKVKKKKAAPKRKSRAKSTEPARLKLFWGVFNQASKRIAKYDFTQKKQAEAKAAELSAGGKNQHFVAKVKEAVEE